MQIVIDVNEEVYSDIMYRAQNTPRDMDDYDLLIANGTPLPKGHGALKDADALIDSLGTSDRDIYCKAVIEEEAPILIKADAESEE